MSIDVTLPEESVAVFLDTVLIPVSSYIVEEIVNDHIYVAEENFSGFGRRIVKVPPGYYEDANDMALGIAQALSTDSMVINPYTVTFNTTMARFQVSNPWTGADEACYILSRYSLLAFSDPSLWGVSVDILKGAFGQLGMVTGPTRFWRAVYWSNTFHSE